MELRYNHNHDEKGRFCSGGGGGRFSSEKSVDNSSKNDTIEETDFSPLMELEVII